MKKILGLKIIIAFILLLTACETEFDLDYYKVLAIEDIEGYVMSNDYNLSNWQIACNLVENGKVTVELAENKSGVDLALSTSKEAIDKLPKEDLSFRWDNESALYVYIKAEFGNEIVQDIDGSFKNLSYQRVYLTEKNVSTDNPLVLLFILDSNDSVKKQEFVNLLMQDPRVSYVRSCRDLPFDRVDERYIEKQKDQIAVGETLQLELKGKSADYYVEPFNFKGLLIKPTANSYSIDDFPIELAALEVTGNGWLYLKLATEGYFSVIKAIDALSKLSIVDKIMVDPSENSLIPPPVWEASCSEVISFESPIEDSIVVVRGIKAGSVVVSIDGISCEITVI